MSLIGTGSPIGRPSGTGKSKESDGLDEMRRRFEHCSSVDSQNRDNYSKDVKLSSSADQWDEEIKKRRGANRPALTFNLLNLVVKQIIGDYRQNKLAIKVLPAGGPATEDIADILAGLIRNIERDSNADQAYTNGLECSARGGFGYFRIVTEYESDDVFNQKLVIKPIHNPLTVYYDPSARMLTREDAQFCLVTEMMPKDEFTRLYPNADPNGWIVDGDSMDDWGDDEQIRVVEYFTKVHVSVKLVAFDSGAVVQIDSDDQLEALKAIGWNPVKTRQADRINIKWQKCTATEVLESATYKTKYIPIIPVLGEEVNVDGQVQTRSSIYYACDAQRSYNYERSTAIERSALSAKAPWIVTQKQIQDYKDQWDIANNTPMPYLVHTPDPMMPQGPQRIEPPSPSVADMQNAQSAAQDVQRTTGVFDSQLGARSNVQSGVGLSEQQQQGVTSTYIFVDNLRSAIQYCGRVLVDWIPSVIDKERIVRTISSEEEIEMQTVNKQQSNPLMGVTEVSNDITVGQYDVVVEAGKAFASRRREAVEGMMKFAQAFPQQAPLIADLMIDNMDVPGGEVMAARLKRSLPPQVVNDPDSPEGQQAAQAAAQQQQQQQATQQQLLQAHIQTEQGKQQADQAKSQASVVKSQAEVVKAKADTIQALADVKKTHIETQQMQKPMEEPAKATPAAPMTIQLAKHPEDIAHSQKASADSDAIKQGIGALIQHAVSSQQKLEGHMEQSNQILAHIAQGHHAVAQAINNQNEIAAAPTEAIRDKMGKMTGSRKVLKPKNE